MEFLGVGYQEILVILAIMLVVVGPDRLPTMAYQIGRAVRTLQTYARAVRDEFSDEFEYLDEQMKTVKGGVADFNKTMKDGERDLRKDLDSVAPAQLLGEQPPSNVVPFGAPGQNGSLNTVQIDGKPVATTFGLPPPVQAPEPAAEPGAEPAAEDETPKAPLV
ncbi:MAG: twin-arginine translocase TatA/TatE family subunit, partial [Dehalococcoidia bacterium]